MIKPNTEKSNSFQTHQGEIASNTRLITPSTTATTDNKYSQPTDTKQLGNTSPNQQNLGILHNHLDWLTVNFTGLTEYQFQSLLERTGRGFTTVEKGESFSQGKKAKRYQNTIHSPIDLKGGYSSYQAEDSLDIIYDVTISLTGEYFSALTTIKQQQLCRDLSLNYPVSCSRIDVSIDDYTFELIPIDKMTEAYRRGDYFDFRKYSHKTDESDSNNPTTTHYFGADGAKRKVRVYNHKNKSLRLETQFRGEYAQPVFQTLATSKKEDETDEEWTKIVQREIGGIAVGAVDFRDKSKLKNQKKACKGKTKRLAFWQEFIDQVGAVNLIRAETKKTDLTMYQNKFNWLETMASKTLAIIFHLLGNDRFICYMYKLVRLGEDKLTPKDRKTIEYLKANLEHLNLD